MIPDYFSFCLCRKFCLEPLPGLFIAEGRIRRVQRALPQLFTGDPEGHQLGMLIGQVRTGEDHIIGIDRHFRPGLKQPAHRMGCVVEIPFDIGGYTDFHGNL